MRCWNTERPTFLAVMWNCRWEVAFPYGSIFCRRTTIPNQRIEKPAVGLVVWLNWLDYRSRRLSNRFAVNTWEKSGNGVVWSWRPCSKLREKSRQRYAGRWRVKARERDFGAWSFFGWGMVSLAGGLADGVAIGRCLRLRRRRGFLGNGRGNQ